MTCPHSLPSGTCTVDWCKEQHWKAGVDARLDILQRARMADAAHVKGLSERLRTTSVALSAITSVNGDPVSLGSVHTDEHGALKLFPDATAEHIVRLVNAEADVVAALEAAAVYLDELDRITVGGAKLASQCLVAVRAALAKLRG